MFIYHTVIHFASSIIIIILWLYQFAAERLFQLSEIFLSKHKY